jgi:hypothetical protein
VSGVRGAVAPRAAPGARGGRASAARLPGRGCRAEAVRLPGVPRDGTEYRREIRRLISSATPYASPTCHAVQTRLGFLREDRPRTVPARAPPAGTARAGPRHALRGSRPAAGVRPSGAAGRRLPSDSRRRQRRGARRSRRCRRRSPHGGAVPARPGLRLVVYGQDFLTETFQGRYVRGNRLPQGLEVDPSLVYGEGRPRFCYA